MASVRAGDDGASDGGKRGGDRPPTVASAGLDVECTMRSIAYDMAMRVPAARRHSDDILVSLNASACPNWTATFRRSDGGDRGTGGRDGSGGGDHRFADPASCPPCDGTTIYVDCEQGSDRKGNDGTSIESPLKTLSHAQDVARRLRLQDGRNRPGSGTTTVYIREGMCYLTETLRLSESDVAWRAYPGERPVLSGGAPLMDLEWTSCGSENDEILVATLPDHVNASAVDGLFTYRGGGSDCESVLSQTRLVRARFPNGNSELDRMPSNYDKLGGSVSSVDAWRRAGNVSVRFPGIEKNSSFYPWFGHSLDVRWVQDYHLENGSSYYASHRQFWQPRIATAARFQSEGRTGALSWAAGAVLHVIHYNWWGNWQWELQRHEVGQLDITDDDPKSSAGTSGKRADSILHFGRGGWQDAHGGTVSHNYFFIENVLEELDAPGEWYVDICSRKIYYWPLPNQRGQMDEWKFVATQIPVIVAVSGAHRRKAHATVRNILLRGITFAHSTTTFLAERYTVPSAGDWSVLPKGAVTLNRAVNVTLDGCTWLQVNGNGVALHGMVHNTTISEGDFLKIGDSGIVLVGRLKRSRPYAESGDVATVPTNITISKCHFGQTGVYGKQTSALFVSISKRIHFIDNVLYDGPRAGININDGFGGGHVIARNVIFNQVLESGDHGPINTWSRSAYVQKGSNGVETLTPEWNFIDQNFIMLGPKFGSNYGPGDGPCSNGDPQFYCPKNGGSLFSCLDHDDGSEYYLDTRNVCAFVGMKNYIGQDKIWDSNIIVFPEGAESQNRSGMPCIWTSMDMAGNASELPCSAKPCRTREVFTNNTCLTFSSTPLEYDMFNETDLALAGNKNTTIPFTARNRYFLPRPYQFHGIWNLSEAKKHGIDIDSVEESLEAMGLNSLHCMSRIMLDMPTRPNYCHQSFHWDQLIHPTTRDSSLINMENLDGGRSAPVV